MQDTTEAVRDLLVRHGLEEVGPDHKRHTTHKIWVVMVGNINCGYYAAQGELPLELAISRWLTIRRMN